MRRINKWLAAIAIVLTLLLTLLPAVPAMAYSLYGQIYDSTDLLDKSRCETMGQQLSDLSAEKQIDLHVDVVDDLEGKDIDDYAKIFYTQYQYGDSTTHDGILLMIYVTEDADGLQYRDHDIVFGGQNKDALRGIVGDMVNGIAPYLNPDAFSGDLQEDNDAFFHALENVVAAVNGESSGQTGAAAVEAAETAEEVQELVSDDAVDGLPPLDQIESGNLIWDQLEGTFVKDAAGLMSAQERQTLEAKAQELAQKYGVGVYVLSVDDYRNYGGSSNIDFWTEKLYIDNKLGLGNEQDGVILVLSMEERDYCLKIYGRNALFAYTDYAQGQLTDRFLSSFRYNDWYGGFSKYMEFGETILEDAQDGSPMEEPVREVNVAGTIGGSALLSAIIGLLTGSGRVRRLKRTMKNTGVKKTAVNYVSQEKMMKLNSKQDHYLNTTVSRVRIHHDSGKSSGGGHGGGGTTINSHGFSGGSGKF